MTYIPPNSSWSNYPITPSPINPNVYNGFIAPPFAPPARRGHPLLSILNTIFLAGIFLERRARRAAIEEISAYQRRNGGEPIAIYESPSPRVALPPSSISLTASVTDFEFIGENVVRTHLRVWNQSGEGASPLVTVTLQNQRGQIASNSRRCILGAATNHLVVDLPVPLMTPRSMFAIRNFTVRLEDY